MHGTKTPIYIDHIFTNSNPTSGMSKPLRILASDGKQYILKNQNVNHPDWDKVSGWDFEDAVFFQETFVAKIAEFLGINTVKAVAITIDEATLTTYPELRFTHHMSKGLYFATEALTNLDNDLVLAMKACLDNHIPYVATSWNNYFRRIVNSDNFAKIICLDILTQNFDRFTNPGNLLFVNDGNNIISVALDYGHCFNTPYWNRTEYYPSKRDILNANLQVVTNANEANKYAEGLYKTFDGVGNTPNSGLGIVFNTMQRTLDFSNKSNPFDSVVRRIDELSEDILTPYLTRIPNEWVMAGDSQRNEYLNFILRQKVVVKAEIELMAKYNCFEHFAKEDALSWSIDLNMNIQ